MSKNKIFNIIIFTSLVMFFAVSVVVRVAYADSTLPDNVKITSSPDGSSTTIIIDSKPGFVTNVQTSCVDNKCTNSATSTVLTTTDIQKMQDNVTEQQEIMDEFWKQQDEIFKEQQKMFQDLWGINGF